MNDGQELVTYIHKHKTADFIQACVSAGAMLAGEADTGAVAEYGAKIGLAFQIVDDILDQTATSELLGKMAGTDHELDKLTYPKAFGLKKSRETAHELVSQAKQALAGCAGDTKMLTMLADYIVSRDH